MLDSQENVVGTLSRYHLLRPNRKKVVLVDHSETAQSVDGLNEAQILAIIDHHRLADVETVDAIYVRTEAVGASTTIIATMFQERGIMPGQKLAGLMAAGILSDRGMRGTGGSVPGGPGQHRVHGTEGKVPPARRALPLRGGAGCGHFGRIHANFGGDPMSDPFPFDPLFQRYPSQRFPLYARGGMVNCSSPQAAAAGLEVLRKGGNAIHRKALRRQQSGV